MSNQSNGSLGGVGFLGLLTLLFIGLKLGHVIDWSWLWVLAPSWISLAVVVVILIVGLFLTVLAHIAESYQRGRNRRGGF